METEFDSFIKSVEIAGEEYEIAGYGLVTGPVGTSVYRVDGVWSGATTYVDTGVSALNLARVAWGKAVQSLLSSHKIS